MIKLKELTNEKDILNEGLKDYLISLGLAATIFLSNNNAEAAVKNNLIKNSKTNQESVINSFTDEIAKYVARNEGVRTKAYLDSKNKLTIGIGHLITKDDKKIFKSLFGENFNYDNMLIGKLELSTEQVQKLFQYDLKRKETLIKKLFPQYDSFNKHVKMAIVDGVFRGDLSGSPKTIKLINSGEWGLAAREYLNNKEYNAAVKSKSGVAKRMNNNSKIYKWMQQVSDWEKSTGKKFEV
jgi:GH24 family phage-related lysozyme (muramidase)